MFTLPPTSCKRKATTERNRPFADREGLKASHLTQRCVGLLQAHKALSLLIFSACLFFGTTCQHSLCLNGLQMSNSKLAEAPMTTKKTPPKYLRMHLHLDENTARQVRLQAHKWGLNDTQTVKQLIRLGLDSRDDRGTRMFEESALDRAVSRAIKPIRDAAIESLFLNKVVVADRRPALLDTAKTLTLQAISDLDKEVEI